MDKIKQILKNILIAALLAWILILEVLGSPVETRADGTSSTTSSTNSGQTLYDALRSIYGSSGSSSSTSSTSSTTVTVEQLMKKMETEPIGPKVSDTELDELYHEDYKVYEERLGDYTIYANVKNGGMTNRPVVIDVPKGVGATMKKDGSDISFISKEVIEGEGAYVLDLFVGSDDDAFANFSDQTFLRAKFRFRIQYETGVNGMEGGSTIGQATENTSEPEADFGDLPEDMRPDDFIYEETSISANETTASENSTPAGTGTNVHKDAELSSGYDSSTGYYINTLRTGETFYTSLPNGSITNEAVLIQEAEGLELKAYRNGQEYEDFVPGEYIQEVGSYAVYASKPADPDYIQAYKFGSPAFRFRILSGDVADMSIVTAPDGATIRNVRFNGIDDDGSLFIDDRSVHLTQDGYYEFTFDDDAGTREVTVSLDTEDPVFTVSVEPNEAAITYYSDDVARCVLYKGNDLISDPTVVTSVTEAGRYRLYVYDTAGNRSMSEFTVRYRINAAAVIAILAVIGIIAGVIVYLIRMKKKVKVV